MTTYIKNDIQNIFINFYNKSTLATTATYYRVLQTTLYNYLNSTQSYQNIYNNK